jgi:DNA polymerase-3 subunit delta
VDQVVSYVKEAVIFDLVDALGHRDSRTAASTLQQLQDDGQPSMAIMAMIIRQFRLLIQVKELRQAGENAASVARELGLHPFPAGKLYQQANNFAPDQLELVYRHLLATDVSIKTGKLTPEVALDVLVAGLTEPPQ